MKHFCEIVVVLTVLVFLPVNCDPIFKPLFKLGKLLIKKELKGGGFGGFGPLGGGESGGGGGGGNIFIGIGIQCNGQGCNGLTAGRDFQFASNGQSGITTQNTQPTSVPTTSFAEPFSTPSFQITPPPSNLGRFQQQQALTSTVTGSSFCGNGCFFDKVIGGCNCKFRSVLSFT